LARDNFLGRERKKEGGRGGRRRKEKKEKGGRRGNFSPVPRSRPLSLHPVHHSGRTQHNRRLARNNFIDYDFFLFGHRGPNFLEPSKRLVEKIERLANV
jgi:hypothetical protein